MRRVVIGTPTYGMIDYRYVDCLVRSVKECAPEVELHPVFMSGDVSNSRNRILRLCIQDIPDVSDLVFIDSDMTWAPASLRRLLAHDLSVRRGKKSPGRIVSGLARLKSDVPTGAFGQRRGEKPDEVGLMKVDWCGTGFLRMDRYGIEQLWARARPYRDGGVALRAVFQYHYDGQMVSEDASMSGSWRALGGECFVDTQVKVGHIGSKVYMVGEG